MAEHLGGRHSCPKNIGEDLNFAKDHIGNQQCYDENVLRQEGHSLPSSKQHPNSEAEWKKHHDLGLLCCARV